MSERKAALERLYGEIHDWGRQHDPAGARRRVDAVDEASRLVLVAEAYAKTTVRITGVNWFNAYGNMGGSGGKLDEILQCVGFTVAPPRAIPVEFGVIPSAKPGRASAYTTDVFPCFPVGRRNPTPSQVKEALGLGFLARELEIVRPAVILLLGARAYEGFYRYVLGKEPVGICAAFQNLAADTAVDRFGGAAVLPWLHTSPGNGWFQQWWSEARIDLNVQPQVRALANALAHGEARSVA